LALASFGIFPKGLVLPLFVNSIAKTHGVFMIKIEPELIKKDETLADLLKLGLVKVRPIQPNFSTILVDISPDLETVLANLNQKGRHAIRRAERDGVTIKKVEATDENCQIMYDLFAHTAANASFRVRELSYHQSFWQRYAKTGLGQLFFAYVEGKVVASAFAIAYGKKGTYKDGASIRERTVYGASHLLQWHVIQWMKAKGVATHDLGGSPPSDQINNPDHKWYGVGRFKTNFNKEVTDYVGAYDCIIRPTAYKLWAKVGERLALRLYDAIHHESYY
jgi:lipid II:glycine glycyltransferase (peptidoglycan interpeptide bridge formation enzyme)